MVAAVVGLTRTTWRAAAVRARRHRRLVAGTVGALVVAGLLASALPARTSHPGPGHMVPEPPARPATLDRGDEQGAAAAAVYVLRLEPYGLLSGDWRAFARLCSAGSGWCRDKTTSMRLVEAGTVGYTGCAVQAEAVRVVPTDAADTFVVTVAQRQEACVRHEATSTGPRIGGPAPAGGGVDVYSGNDDPDSSLPDLLDLTVRHDGDGWHVLRASLA